ncbi:MAG: hypothetical protein IJJ59_02495 [Pseudobutyrivibrio sp.]|uniref:hypothetical protein n=1 Tax=Pseudobutyrivibrio sp. TaxID=2014367 RepID=UPI0025D91CED|nr:hypothetical protein [Pseudobutyrivibrio sp.]MBQ6462177.1 hypothetical protein [Pseudobutyrivibrio sp.]
MIFEYEELKECVQEDFDRFYGMGFNEKQIFPAVLNEYEHGVDYDQAENVCVHIFLVLNYMDKNMDYSEIIEKIKSLISDEAKRDIEDSLGNDYVKFVNDLRIINMV